MANSTKKVEETTEDGAPILTVDSSIKIYGKEIKVQIYYTVDRNVTTYLNKEAYHKYTELSEMPKYEANILRAEKELESERETFEQAVKKLSRHEDLTPDESKIIEISAGRCFEAEKFRFPECVELMRSFEKCVKKAAVAVVEKRTMDFGIDPFLEMDLFRRGFEDAKNINNRWIAYVHTLMQHEVIMKLMMNICDEKVFSTNDQLSEADRLLNKEFNKIEKRSDISEPEKILMKRQLQENFVIAQRDRHREIDKMTRWKKRFEFYHSSHHLERSMKKNQRIFREPTSSAKHLAMIYLDTQCESIPKAYFKIKEMREEIGYSLIMTPHKLRLTDMIFYFGDFMEKWGEVMAEVWDTNKVGSRQDVKKELLILCQQKLPVLKSECYVEDNPTPQKKIKELTERISSLEKQVEELDFPFKEPKEPVSERITPPREKPIKTPEKPDPLVMNRLNLKNKTLAKTKLEVLNIIMQSLE